MHQDEQDETWPGRCLLPGLRLLPDLPENPGPSRPQYDHRGAVYCNIYYLAGSVVPRAVTEKLAMGSYISATPIARALQDLAASIDTSLGGGDQGDVKDLVRVQADKRAIRAISGTTGPKQGP